MKHVLFGAVAAASLAATAYALAPTSGLAVGEKVSPFHPQHVAGPLANSDKCFPCTFQARPQVQVWVNGDNMANVAKIGMALEKAAGTHSSKEFKAMIVMVTPKDQVEAMKAKAGEFARSSGFKSTAIAILAKNDDAVTAYKFNTSADVKNTVFAYKDWTVKAKMVNLVGDEAGIKSLNDVIAGL
jgi:hypothetical protein